MKEAGRQQHGTASPCAACKLLRRRCAWDCVFAPHFPADEPQKFANVHRVLVYEANARVRDPVYGCVGVISSLHCQVQALEAQLAMAQAQMVRLRMLAHLDFGRSPTGTGSTTTEDDRRRKLQRLVGGPPPGSSAAPCHKPRHPLHQIAESATHKLLLKQWMKEEEIVARRVALRESRVDAVRGQIAALYCLFFVLHSLVLLLLYHASASARPPSAACRRSWIPCLCSLVCSLAIVWAVRYKADTESVLERLLEREREDGLLLAKCVEELKRKGAEFDLLKEVDALRRAKSLRVEAKGGAAKVRKWSARDLAAMVLLALSCGALGLTRFVLCNQEPRS
ncbi:hypothetical protein B296_00019261 [Ensete ventricosum]|uniref:LOB domain-containing protein n=1 Tax=Ensete ventricosum TaxID=4639 RepID=A0A426ZAF0_ENSVE|nr:hypothetical protein B296_00019261 [Ensete ventricosum]